MTVIFVNRYFHPDLSATSQLLSDLAVFLAGQGRSIRVVTGRTSYDDPALRFPAQAEVDGVQVHRVWTARFGRARLLGRAVDDLTFYVAAAWCLWRRVRAGDVVVVKTDPPLIAVVALAICRLRGARAVNWLQDLFPEVAQALGLAPPGSRLVYPLLTRLRDASLRGAAANVVIGDTMAARVGGRGVPPARIRLIRNWTDREAVRPIAHPENPFRRGIVGPGPDPFVVAYSGNLGRVHEIETLLDAMAMLAADTAGDPRPVRWLFIGSGALTPRLRAEVARLGFGTVAFLPYQPRGDLAFSLSAADAHLACLRPEFEGLVVPSKVSGAAAAGRPILFVGDPEGEIARFIARHRCGIAIARGDGAGLARAIRTLAEDPAACEAMGRQARAGFEAECDRTEAFARWTRLLDAVEGR